MHSAFSLVFRTSWLTYFSLYLLLQTSLTRNYYVMTWLLNNLREKISGNVIFFITAKKMWDTLKVMYENEKNSSRVFEIYECLFELKHGDKYMFEFYRELKRLIDELEMHRLHILMQRY